MGSETQTKDGFSSDILLGTPMSYFGFGLYQAWYWMLHNTSRVYPLGIEADPSLAAARVVGIGVQVAVLGAILLSFRRTKGDAAEVRKERARLWSFIAGFGGFIATGIIIAGNLSDLPALAWAGWILWGITSCPIIAAWIRLYSITDVRNLCFLVSGSYVAGAVITYALCYIPLVPALLVTAILPLLSACLSRSAQGIKCEITPTDLFLPVVPRSPRFSYVVRLFIVICAFALIYSTLVAPLGTRRGAGFETNNGYMLLAPLLMGVIFIAIVRFAKDTTALNRIFRAILPITVLSLLILPFAQGSVLSVAGLIGAAGFECFSIVYWALLLDAARYNHLSSLKVLLVGRMVYGIGIIAGTCFSSYLSAFELFRDKQLFTLLCLSSVMILVVLGTLFLHDKEILQGQSNPRMPGGAPDFENAPQMPLPAAEDIFRMKTERITDRFGLTPRECEVFVLLAKGRSNKLIQERLFISTHTVDSHVTHIYRKCGVHSRQEIMDLIEQEHIDVGAR